MSLKPTFATGLDAAAQYADELSPKKGPFSRFDWFKLEDGKSLVARFVTDAHEIPSLATHTSTPTKSKPSDYKGNWPTTLPTPCRKDKAFKGIFEGCYVCDTPLINPRNDKPVGKALRAWAVAVEREEVPGKPGQRRDVEIEWDEYKDGQPTGKKIKGKRFLIINQPMKTFFDQLHALAGMTQTICDQDFIVKRTGGGLDTNYVCMPLGQQLIDGKAFGPIQTPELWAEYTKAMEAQNIDLTDVIMEQVGDERWNKFFVQGVSATPAYSTSPVSYSEAAPPVEGQVVDMAAPAVTTTEPDEGTISALKARIAEMQNG